MKSSAHKDPVTFSVQPTNVRNIRTKRTRRAFVLFGGSAIYGLLAALMLFGANQGEGFGVPGVGWV